MDRKLLVSQIQTPDGTILASRHVHDYVTYTDKNGYEYMLDGGNEYQRCFVNEHAPHKDASLYSDSPFEEVRKAYCIGEMALRDINDDTLMLTVSNSKDIFSEKSVLCARELTFRKTEENYGV